MDADEPGLVRYWFDFDLATHQPDPPPPGHIRLDGGTPTYRLLGRGAGVTGYDEADCLALIGAVLDDEPPPVLRAQRNPFIDETLARQIGNVAWRGVWFPRLNLRGPTLG